MSQEPSKIRRKAERGAQYLNAAAIIIIFIFIGIAVIK